MVCKEKLAVNMVILPILLSTVGWVSEAAFGLWKDNAAAVLTSFTGEIWHTTRWHQLTQLCLY